MVELYPHPTEANGNPSEVNLQKSPKEEEEQQCLLSVPRQLVLSVCEPYMRLRTVNTPLGYPFNMYQFGLFEVMGVYYVFGCEENQYNYSLKHNDSRIPAIIAKVINPFSKSESLEMVTASTFNQKELVVVNDAILYTLECQRVSGLYAPSHCG